jgi:hypothetical protein
MTRHPIESRIALVWHASASLSAGHTFVGFAAYLAAHILVAGQ